MGAVELVGSRIIVALAALSWSTCVSIFLGNCGLLGKQGWSRCCGASGESNCDGKVGYSLDSTRFLGLFYSVVVLVHLYSWLFSII